MTHIAILLACEHYPEVSTDPRAIDAQLGHWLSEQGLSPTEITVWKAYDEADRAPGGQVDAWIVSGVPLEDLERNRRPRIKPVLQAAAALQRPILALNHGEHVVHDVLAALDAPRPQTPRHLRSIRNPFRSFWSRDQLFRFHPLKRQVVALSRPEVLSAWHFALPRLRAA